MKPSALWVNSLFMLQVSSPAIAATDELLQMTPSSRWAINYEQDSCALQRSFENGSDRAALELRSFWDDDNLEVTVASTVSSGAGREVRTRFEPDSKFSKSRDVGFLQAPPMTGVRYTDSLLPAELKTQASRRREWPQSERDARERAITEMRIAGAFRQVLALRTGQMSDAMAALRTCLDNLKRRAGFDPVVQRSLSQKVVGFDQMNWARRAQGELPSEILRSRGSGYALLRVLVGSDGKVTACTSLRSSGAATFPKYACDTALKYARFKPAVDAHGKPVASATITKLTYSV